MSTLQTTSTGPSAMQWMMQNRMHMPREANEVAGKSVSVWPGIAAIPLLAISNFSTNSALDYTVYFDAGHTNPTISMPNDAPADWMHIEEGELGNFLAFLDTQMESRPDLIEPADEAQLDRLAKLLANVKV
ncbi:MAG: hypothetical protein FD187_1761 [bacterium]|nr:MAG: hypothetical protein FD142_738 [bacterium]KAF0148715.1 MAG: hypothetical protein FD187_1761 [bacterium]KAF0168205.1 MAG: hypothetical protein FD158_1598 [bacterium]TXT18728.1 MAG: hypothetical protein FD132_2002 [bacterium]